MRIIIVIALSIMLLQACNSNKKSTKSYLDPALPVNDRVELLLAEMTLDEKIGQMCQYVAEPARNFSGNTDEEVNYTLSIGDRADLIRQDKIGSFLKVANYQESNFLQKIAEQSRLKIPLLITEDAIHGLGMYDSKSTATYTTIYPTEIGIASTFDTTLAFKLAKYTATEMRAIGFHLNYSPNIEVVRDPRWGRTGETFGEDTYLVSMMGRAMIHGYQGTDFGQPDNIISCAKHFVGGGIPLNGLNGTPADVSERTLTEFIFPPFAEAVKAGVFSLMPAHNEINGIPCHAHKQYLTGMIRDKWGFDGIYISDWMDVAKLFNLHKVAATLKDASIISVDAGIDIHMHGPGFFDHIKEAVEEGRISEERINESARRILYAKFQLGLFENRYADSAKVRTILRKKEHLDLSLEISRKSLVLLKNEGNILPLDKKKRSIFVTGPCADNQTILGDWSRSQPDENVTTILEGIKSIVSEKTRIDFLPVTRFDTVSNDILAKAKLRAALSDIAIVVVGDNSLRFDRTHTAGENMDRPTLELAGQQLDLLKAVESAGKPVIVVLVNGGPIASPWMEENVEGILEAWEPGPFGGQAVAEVLFGDVNPSGKLPITVPRTVGHIQNFYNQKPSGVGRGVFYMSSRKPLFDFGAGLSYTNFSYTNFDLPEKIGIEDSLKFSLSVSNDGQVPGDEVVLIYINDKVSSVTSPVKKLVAFRRIHLDAGEKTDLKFLIPGDSFKLYDRDMIRILEPGKFDIIIGNDILRSEIAIE